MPRKLTFYEFFAGGGMARLGLGDDWTCLFANDIDADKAAAYRANWGDADFVEGDLGAVRRAGNCPAAPISPGLPFPARTCRSPAAARAWAGPTTR